MTHPLPSPEHGASTRRGILLMLLAVLLFGAIDALSKLLVANYPVAQLVWARYAVHLFVMLAVLAPRLGLDLLRTGRPVLQIVRAGLLVVSTAAFFTGLRYLPLADAVAIAFISPILVTVLAIPLLKERVGRRRWAAVAVGFLGMLVIIRPGAGVVHWAVVFPLTMAVCYGLYQIVTRILSATERPLTTLFYTALIGTLGASLAAPFFWRMPDLGDGLAMAGLGIFGGLGHFALIKAFELAPASTLAPLFFTQLIWATVAGILMFGELPDLWTAAGALIIVAAGVFIFYRERVTASAGRPADPR